MLWFDPAKRHGFVPTADGELRRVDQDGFAAGKQLEDRCTGRRGSFDRIGEQAEEPRVATVAVLLPSAVRLARSRGRR